MLASNFSDFFLRMLFFLAGCGISWGIADYDSLVYRSEVWVSYLFSVFIMLFVK
jgi:hypothetical protein